MVVETVLLPTLSEDTVELVCVEGTLYDSRLRGAVIVDVPLQVAGQGLVLEDFFLPKELAEAENIDHRAEEGRLERIQDVDAVDFGSSILDPLCDVSGLHSELNLVILLA